MFDKLKKSVQNRFANLADKPLFYVEIDRDLIWEKYLSGFTDETRQGNNCNCCKSFLRQFAGIVTIQNNQVVSIWDGVNAPEEYAQSIENVRQYIHSLPVTDRFLNSFKKCGTDKNLDQKRSIVWKHFYIELPDSVIVNNVATRLGASRTNKQVFKRALDELTIDATETILELIAQGSLYRGEENKGVLTSFLKLQKAYKKVPAKLRDNYCWLESLTQGGAVTHIRDSAIGTLLIDLSEGVNLDTAVTKYERVVAPTNYKRPTALVTPKMVENAKATLNELGLLPSLERRFANDTDVSVNDVLFKHSPKPAGDVFAEIAQETIVNPRTFAKVEEISINDFLANVVPTTKSISVLFENRHLDNLVSIIAAQDPDALNLFKWNNDKSWSYTGGITDSIKELVKNAGGQTSGELRVSLAWHNHDDLDLHIYEPGLSGSHIYFRNKRQVHLSSGMLDVDMNAGFGTTRTPVENIIYTDRKKMPEGRYRVQVNNYSKRETSGQGFTLQIEHAGEVFDFEFAKNPRDGDYQDIVEFDYSRMNGITFVGDVKSNVISREKWGIGTNQFHKVTKLMLSPNYWGEQGIGNKHYFFLLENCISDETPRPFFNEFLKQELDVHRKVLEVVGGKIKIEHTPNQLSGLGFSETKRAQIIARVEGKFSRVLKINV